MYLWGKERRASTASEYPLAIFGFRKPSPKPEKCLLGTSQTLIRKEARYHDGKPKTKYPGEVLCDRRGKGTDGTYLRKMAIDGYIIYVDTRDIKEMNKLLSAIGRNINQIAKRLNTGGPAYQADMEEIRERMNQIWQLQRRILLSQR